MPHTFKTDGVLLPILVLPSNPDTLVRVGVDNTDILEPLEPVYIKGGGVVGDGGKVSESVCVCESRGGVCCVCQHSQVHVKFDPLIVDGGHIPPPVPGEEEVGKVQALFIRASDAEEHGGLGLPVLFVAVDVRNEVGL